MSAASNGSATTSCSSKASPDASFIGNACAIFDDGLAGLIGILEHDAVDMDHHLVVLGRRARIDAVVERGLSEQLQRVGLLLMGCTPSVRHGN